MKIFKKKIWAGWSLSAIVLLAALGIAKAVFVQDATNVNSLAIDGTGIYDSSGTLRISVGNQGSTIMGPNASGVLIPSNLTIQSPYSIYYGSATLSLSTATTSGSQGSIQPLYLGGNTAAVQGSVLIATTPVAGFGTTVAVSIALSSQTSVVGIAQAAASTGSIVNVYYGSNWVLALTTGVVATGDSLQTSSLAAGYLQTMGNGTSISTATAHGSVVGVAQAGGIAGGGLTRIKLLK